MSPVRTASQNRLQPRARPSPLKGQNEGRLAAAPDHSKSVTVHLEVGPHQHLHYAHTGVVDVPEILIEHIVENV